MKTYDLNMFYREDWTEEEGTTVADTLTIEVYLYVDNSDCDISCDQFPGVLFECTLEETQMIAKDFPIDQYGDDWFVDRNWYYEHGKSIPPRLFLLLLQLPDVEPITTKEQAQYWWLSMGEPWIDQARKDDLTQWIYNSTRQPGMLV